VISFRFHWPLFIATGLLASSCTCSIYAQGNSTSGPSSPAASTQADAQTSSQSSKDAADQQLKQQEKQRIMGVIPNFNTTDLQNAVALTPRQKFHLAFKSASDPFQAVAAGLTAGMNQAENSFPGYGQGAQGYFKRFGASYADSVDGTFWGNAVYPILFHEDPRYFRRGHGSFKSRFLYSVSTTVWTRRDNGNWGPNYANVLGNFTAGGISNLYYPSTDRGFGLTMQGAATVTAEGAIGALFVEFWPDISHKLFHKKDR
jgi:hypothetical protein